MDIGETFVTGFCKAQNQTRMVVLEFEQKEDGTRVFLDSDCAYGKCPHSRDCLLMAQAGDQAGTDW
ncbi:MAG: ubiquinone biosynthesis protein UbiE [Lachnospiraceae bacterium]|nr:ubiquinone biosynthesis protein UbiE [Lachnospiraceae bacterium]